MSRAQSRAPLRSESPPSIVAHTVTAQDVKVAGRVEFGNTVSLNAAVVVQILKRLRDMESKQAEVKQSLEQITVNLDDILRRLAAAEAGLEQLRQETQLLSAFLLQSVVVLDAEPTS